MFEVEERDRYDSIRREHETFFVQHDDNHLDDGWEIDRVNGD